MKITAEEKVSNITSNWMTLRGQLLLQWRQLTAKDLDQAGPNRQRLAQVIGRKCGIASRMVEMYLYNFEQTMPLLSAAGVKRAA